MEREARLISEKWWADWPHAEVFLGAIPDFVSVEQYHRTPPTSLPPDEDASMFAGAEWDARVEDGRIVAIQFTVMNGAWFDGRLEALRAQRGSKVVPDRTQAGAMVTATSPACRS